MKKRIFILVLVFNFQSSFSQSYESLLSTDKQWNILFTSYNLGNDETEPPIYYHTSINQLSEEISVEGVDYHQLIANGNPQDIYLREDTATQTVYRIPAISGEEDLVYDFSLEVGEKLVLPNSISGIYETWQVTTVSYEYFAGYTRKRIALINTSDEYDEWEDIWYEGIGSLNGLIYSGSYYWVDNSVSLLCYHVNDEVLYQNGSSCNINTVEVHEDITNPFTVYPNPVGSVLNIDSNLPHYSILLYNLLGKEVLKTETSSFKTKLDLHDFYLGIYLIEIKNEDYSFTSKLVKN